MQFAAGVDSRPSERRRHARIGLDWDATVGFANDSDVVRATIQDVSMGGVCLIAPLQVVVGDEVLAVLTFADETIAALARVMNAEPVGSGQHRLHLQFRWLQDSSRRSLEGIVPMSADAIERPHGRHYRRA